MDRELWLFTRGEESVRIQRNPSALIVVVNGPGAKNHVHQFDGLRALDAFTESFLAELEDDGWALHATVDRRRSAARSPGSEDRRRRPEPAERQQD